MSSMPVNSFAAVRGRAAVVTACLAACLAAPAAWAADPPATPAASKPAAKPAAKGAGKGKNVMTRDELRACMDEQDRLQGLRSKVEKEQASLDRTRNEVASIDEQLARKRETLDPADEPGKQALDAEVVRRDQIAEAYNARVAALREQGRTFDAGRESWVARCANRDFDEMDEAAIKKERQRAARATK
jgi:hypothetical protein